MPPGRGTAAIAAARHNAQTGVITGQPNAAACTGVSVPLSGNSSPITGNIFMQIDTGGLTLVNGTYAGTLFIQSFVS